MLERELPFNAFDRLAGFDGGRAGKVTIQPDTRLLVVAKVGVGMGKCFGSHPLIIAEKPCTRRGRSLSNF